MRRDVQEIFRATPTQKQVMMFSATLSQEVRPICKKFMQNPLEIYVDDEKTLTLHGLNQFYIKLDEKEKNRRLNELLDDLQFNQAIIFVKSTVRATELDKLLTECNFPSVAVHSGVSQEERYVKSAKRATCCADCYLESTATSVLRNSKSGSVSLLMFSDVVLILSVSISQSTTIFPLMPIHTYTVSVVPVVSVPRVSQSLSLATRLMRRS